MYTQACIVQIVKVALYTCGCVTTLTSVNWPLACNLLFVPAILELMSCYARCHDTFQGSKAMVFDRVLRIFAIEGISDNVISDAQCVVSLTMFATPNSQLS